jgi:hypothetical protein
MIVKLVPPSTPEEVERNQLLLELREASDKLVMLAVAREDLDLMRVLDEFVAAASRCIARAGGL